MVVVDGNVCVCVYEGVGGEEREECCAKCEEKEAKWRCSVTLSQGSCVDVEGLFSRAHQPCSLTIPKPRTMFSENSVNIATMNG